MLPCTCTLLPSCLSQMPPVPPHVLGQSKRNINPTNDRDHSALHSTPSIPSPHPPEPPGLAELRNAEIAAIPRAAIRSGVAAPGAGEYGLARGAFACYDGSNDGCGNVWNEWTVLFVFDILMNKVFDV
ncbi:uncharacterized protein M421DRAFT_224231 [Didymella exigua CBS 183.55]|uniref:Uncharacterized protein n=1 Tax=Didymella exigua CBS 183.55 TaxID=1150837 RepID=A0A6A5RHY6_9PLEO|nr:uncharacterized protein M421DRAFT_224231 [Didymella exigua CBS 183.55]KAF1926066.1 hypothetical protein M421DRAFT_224231 [Didymella exigua CBS 183.55]